MATEGYRRTSIRRGLILAVLLVACLSSLTSAQQGLYFSKDEYVTKPLPRFEATRDKLPSPIFDEDSNYIRCYWKTWELAFRNFHEPAPESGFVSQFIDAAFNQNIFLWDTCFLTMFCNYGHPYVPGIGSLDNFYIKQHEDGEICREINRTTGLDYEPWVNKENKTLFSRWGYNLPNSRGTAVVYRGRSTPTPNPKLTLDSLNHPIFAWAEMESFQLTGDKDRLERVWEPLVRYYAAMKKYLRQGNGLYVTDWASMDNSARNPYLISGGTGIDISSEMALFARNLAEMATILGKTSEAQRYSDEAEELSERINKLMWDPQQRFYFDLTLEGKRAPVKSIAAFWSLLAQVASKSQAEALATELRDPKTFKTVHRVPTLAADQAGYNPNGGYWMGSVWAPTDKMVVAGLEKYGYTDLAAEIALNHLECIVDVFKETGTVWENYAPSHVAPGKPARTDFVGWTGIAPISFFIEYAIGIKADAPANEITWHIRSPERVGIERFWFGGKTVSLVCEEPATDGSRSITVKSDGTFQLMIVFGDQTRTVAVPANKEIQLSL